MPLYEGYTVHVGYYNPYPSSEDISKVKFLNIGDGYCTENEDGECIHIDDCSVLFEWFNETDFPKLNTVVIGSHVESSEHMYLPAGCNLDILQCGRSKIEIAMYNNRIEVKDRYTVRGKFRSFAMICEDYFDYTHSEWIDIEKGKTIVLSHWSESISFTSNY